MASYNMYINVPTDYKEWQRKLSALEKSRGWVIYPEISILQTPSVDIQLRRTLDQYKEKSHCAHLFLFSK